MSAREGLDPESYHGAIQLTVTRVFEWMTAQPLVVQPSNERSSDQVVFRGRTRHDTKRAMLRYWSRNEAWLGLELEEFQRCCSWHDDTSVSFRTPRPRR